MTTLIILFLIFIIIILLLIKRDELDFSIPDSVAEKEKELYRNIRERKNKKNTNTISGSKIQEPMIQDKMTENNDDIENMKNQSVSKIIKLDQLNKSTKGIENNEEFIPLKGSFIITDEKLEEIEASEEEKIINDVIIDFNSNEVSFIEDDILYNETPDTNIDILFNRNSNDEDVIRMLKDAEESVWYEQTSDMEEDIEIIIKEH